MHDGLTADQQARDRVYSQNLATTSKDCAAALRSVAESIWLLDQALRVSAEHDQTVGRDTAFAEGFSGQLAASAVRHCEEALTLERNAAKWTKAAAAAGAKQQLPVAPAGAPPATAPAAGAPPAAAPAVAASAAGAPPAAAAVSASDQFLQDMQAVLVRQGELLATNELEALDLTTIYQKGLIREEYNVGPPCPT